MSRGLVSWWLLAIPLCVTAVSRADVPNLNFTTDDATGCGDIFVAKVNTDGSAAVTVDGYPPRAGFGAITDKGETKEIDINSQSWITIGLDVRQPGAAALNYCEQDQDSYDKPGITPPESWTAVSGHISLKLYSETSNQYADATLTNVLFVSPDAKNSVTLPSLKLSHAHIGWYTPG